MWNRLPIMETVYNAIMTTGLPSRLIYAGSDELIKIPRVKNETPFVIIDDAHHDFSNKWDELTGQISDFVKKI